MNKLKGIAVGFLFAAFAFIGFSVITSAVTDAISSGIDCTDGAVIRCGVSNATDLAQKFAANATGDLPAIYNHYGIPSGLILSGNAQLGTVKQDGTVVYNGKVVATNAGTVGRLGYAGDHTLTIDGKTFYEHSTQKSFRVSEVQALLFFDGNGQFIGAILLSCGNPIYGVAVKPQPEYHCDALQFQTFAGQGTNTVRANVAYTAKNGASATGFIFDWGDGSNETWAGPTRDHTYVHPGTYTVRATVQFSVNGVVTAATSDNCVKQVTIKPTPIQVCDLNSGKMVTIDQSDFDSSRYSKNPADCQMSVCDLSSNTVVTIEKSDFDSSKYTTDQSKCAMISVCDLSTYQTVSIANHEYDSTKYGDASQCVKAKYCRPSDKSTVWLYPNQVTTDVTTDFSQCEVTKFPVTGSGIADILSGGLGVGALTTAGIYYIASRRNR